MKTLFLILLIGVLLQASYIKTDGIVSDSETGLMWQDDYDNNSTTIGDSISDGNWTHAISYCDDLIGLGYDDWRLPNKNELLLIVDNTSRPTIDSAFEHTSSNMYWSVTVSTANSTDAWGIDFYNGVEHTMPKSNYAKFRCIRGSADPLVVPVISVPILTFLLE